MALLVEHDCGSGSGIGSGKNWNRLSSTAIVPLGGMPHKKEKLDSTGSLPLLTMNDEGKLIFATTFFCNGGTYFVS